MVMIWFFPLMVVGGLFWPYLGYLVPVMMIFFLVLAWFKHRFWCWNLCPRGAFLDIVLARISLGRPLPKVFSRTWFRWTVFAAFLVFMGWRIAGAVPYAEKLGLVFIVACIVTSVFAVAIGIPGRARGWCMICPMGTLQDAVGRAGRSRRKGPSAGGAGGAAA